MFEAIFGALIGCAGYCVALCFGTTRGTRFSGRAWWRIGPPCIAMGISGTLLFIAGNKALYGPAGWYSTAGWIIFACALSFLIRVYITESNKEERLQKIKELSIFYNECIENNVRSCKSEKDRQKASLIAKKYNIYYADIEALYNEAKQCYQEKLKTDKEYARQKELVELKQKEQAQYDVLNEFSSYTEREKKIAMLTKEYNEAARNLRATNDAISMTLTPPLEEEHDWAVMGGLADGLAGPGAGIATAVNAQIENAQIRARNSQLLHETADIRGQMILAGAKQRNALQARLNSDK